MAVCPPPAEVIEELEVENEFAAEDNVDDVIQYTDPAGNTFEAPLLEAIEAHNVFVNPSEEPKTEKLSLDDILIRLPNEEKAKEEPDFSLDFTSSDEEEDSDFIPDLF